MKLGERGPRVGGLEPPSTVLETAALPLSYTRLLILLFIFLNRADARGNGAEPPRTDNANDDQKSRRAVGIAGTADQGNDRPSHNNAILSEHKAHFY